MPRSQLPVTAVNIRQKISKELFILKNHVSAQINSYFSECATYKLALSILVKKKTSFTLHMQHMLATRKRNEWCGRKPDDTVKKGPSMNLMHVNNTGYGI